MSDTVTDMPRQLPQAPVAIMRVEPRSLREPSLDVAFVELDAREVARRGIATHTCPQCGLNPAGFPERWTFRHFSRWTYFALFMNTFVALVVGLASYKQVSTRLALCPDCRRAHSRAKVIRAASVVSAMVSPLAAGVASIVLDLGLTASALTLGTTLVASAVGMLTAHWRTRADSVVCKRIDNRGRLTLRASSTFERVVAAEAPHLLYAKAGPFEY